MMENVKVGYKVVRRCGKTARSKIFKPVTEEALQSIRYRINQWTLQRPQDHGAFAVFDNLADAKNFASRFKAPQIFSCEYKESNENKLWRKMAPIFVKGYHGYYPISAGIISWYLEDCPEGTVLASAVRLVEQVA